MFRYTPVKFVEINMLLICHTTFLFYEGVGSELDHYHTVSVQVQFCTDQICALLKCFLSTNGKYLKLTGTTLSIIPYNISTTAQLHFWFLAAAGISDYSIGTFFDYEQINLATTQISNFIKIWRLQWVDHLEKLT